MKNSSTFKIQSQSDLSASDHKVLALLYQPMIGVDAQGLYTTLYQLINKTNKNVYTHLEIFDLLDFKQNQFLKARNKLEAINLINVYKKDDEFRYLLKTPLSAKQFLIDTVLGSYLQSEIGEKNLDLITSLFKTDSFDTEGFTNITKSFDTLYEFKSLSLLNVDYPLQGRTQNGGSRINYKFNYEAFVEHLPPRLKNSQLLNQKFIEQITKISFVYQFDVSDMVVIYEQASLSKQVVNFAQLNLKAKKHYEQKHQLLTIKQKDLPKPSLIDQVAPQVIIQKYAKTNQQGIALATATSLLERNAVEPGVLNVILMLVLKHKDGVLPNINYLETVLHDWLNKGVVTTEDAIEHAQNIETKFKKKKKAKSEKEPEWMDSYIDNIAKMEG